MQINNGLIITWYKDSTYTTIASNTTVSKIINLPISFTQKQSIGIATFLLGSADNWARSEILFVQTNLTTAQMVLYCHDYSAIIAINALYIGF